ncbi:aconitate hydratase AcnA [candidate division KSB1 bacterium]|nr:aconitate hydratase AcnA [candidate division KSB1 bacterium]
MSTKQNSFGTRDILKISGYNHVIFRLDQFEKKGLGKISHLPFSIKILLESLLRHEDGLVITAENIKQLLKWNGKKLEAVEVPFQPARVVLQDFTGVPAVVDLAALRDAMVKLGGNPQRINPQIPVDLVIDHSVQVDRFGVQSALAHNVAREFERNRERYEFLKWASQTFKNFRVVPPATGIIHQVNLEYLATVVQRQKNADGEVMLFPDSLVGTDSHTTMINGLGVLGWGVGGIEAEATMLGQPIYLLMPEVIGVKLSGNLPEGVTATDLVLVITQMLRKKGVVGKFVEFFGSGLSSLTLPDRATLANMAPEYGATIGFFPVDDQTVNYLKLSGRTDDLVNWVERYCKEQGLFRTDNLPDPEFSDIVHLDLNSVEPSMAGPKRPHDRVRVKDVKTNWHEVLVAPVASRGFALKAEEKTKMASVTYANQNFELKMGSVVIAAITSCTNTSNPGVMLGAALLAKKAVEAGLQRKPWVKTSLAPGSTVVTRYLQTSGLMPYLEALGFHVVGYGCTTCIGNAGPLPEPISKAIHEQKLVAVSVLSGNRNFEGRISPDVQANYLASPPLVVAYALAGTIDIDLLNEPLGINPNEEPVYLKDLWPTQAEITAVVEKSISSQVFREQYANVFNGNELWNQIPAPTGEVYAWDSQSTYIMNPPFFQTISADIPAIKPIKNARVLAWLPDSTTTDHISPAGSINKNSPAGQYLIQLGVQPKDFNAYGARRGNHEVMMRGTLANIRIKNKLIPGVEGGFTAMKPGGEVLTIWDAAVKYKSTETPLIILAGKEYGSGSSRDWAAKGVFLLGVKAVIAESYERIHRSNLVGMGVLPLQFKPGENCESLGLTGYETFEISGLNENLTAQMEIHVRATSSDKKQVEFVTDCRIDTPVEVEYFRHGGILNMVLRKTLFD